MSLPEGLARLLPPFQYVTFCRHVPLNIRKYGRDVAPRRRGRQRSSGSVAMASRARPRRTLRQRNRSPRPIGPDALSVRRTFPSACAVGTAPGRLVSPLAWRGQMISTRMGKERPWPSRRHRSRCWRSASVSISWLPGTTPTWSSAGNGGGPVGWRERPDVGQRAVGTTGRSIRRHVEAGHDATSPRGHALAPSGPGRHETSGATQLSRRGQTPSPIGIVATGPASARFDLEAIHGEPGVVARRGRLLGGGRRGGRRALRSKDHSVVEGGVLGCDRSNDQARGDTT